MANTYLTKTSTATGTNTKATFSAWVKRSDISSNYPRLVSILPSANNGLEIFFRNTDTLEIKVKFNGATRADLQTNRLFRDVNAWYHILVSIDSTSGTADDRVRLYINGVKETSFGTRINPDQNANMKINASGETFQIGAEVGGSSNNFSGSLSHAHWIDGTAYDASAFGETDATTGEWVGKTSPSVTYGTNGFFILKDGNGITDQSGEGNDFTLGGGTLTDLKDNPENVFATLNPLDTADATDFSSLLQNGNNTLTGSANDKGLRGTLGALSGKFYWEIKANDEGDTLCVARSDVRLQINNTSGTPSTGFWGVQSNGAGANINTYENGTFASSNALQGYASNTIIGIALDMDNGKIYYSFNGVFKGRDNNSSDPANQTNPFFSSLPTDGTFIMPFTENRSSGGSTYYNFGNGLFGTTAITTNSGNGYSGAEGSSKFNYTVPTGYSALNTKGLNQ